MNRLVQVRTRSRTGYNLGINVRGDMFPKIELTEIVLTRFKKLARVLVCSAVCLSGADIVSSTGYFEFVSQAEARQKTLYETLFPRAAARRRARELARLKGNAVEVKKISAPRYYRYQPETLKFINFAPLSAMLALPATDPTEVESEQENMSTGSIVTKTNIDAPKADMSMPETAAQSDAVNGDMAIDAAQQASHSVETPAPPMTDNAAPTASNDHDSASGVTATGVDTMSMQDELVQDELVSHSLMFVDHLDALAKVSVKATSGIREALELRDGDEIGRAHV